MIGIVYVYNNPEIMKSLQKKFGENDKYCETDGDCACGVHINTGDCFYGNKNYVNTLQQCPDFCSGIAGDLIIKCIDNECKQTE